MSTNEEINRLNAELASLKEQNALLTLQLEDYKNALSKACGDDEEAINATLESVQEPMHTEREE